MKFCRGGMLAATRVKMSDREKRMNKNTSEIPSLKSVTRKFLGVSRNICAKQRQRNVQKKCAARAKCAKCAARFLLIRPIDVSFYRSRCFRRLALTILYFV